MTLRIDLYCRVVDNFGDAGVCWRLARQLVAEHRAVVRLVIDRPEYVGRFAKAGDLAGTGVQVIDWSSPPADLPDVVIAAFQCRLPERVETEIAARQEEHRSADAPSVLWINLDYLSGESWVDGVHGRPSIKSNGATEWFFLPGFTGHSGGLIREREFDRAPAGAGQPPFSAASAQTLRVSLFCYSGQDIRALVAALADMATRRSQPVELLVTAGCDLADIRRQLRLADDIEVAQHDHLTIRMVPWMSQREYDLLLAGCDLNFVRGEDSWIRAIWAGRPFVWSPYRQEDGAHLAKLSAFLRHLEPAFVPSDFEVVRRAMLDWAANSTSGDGEPDSRLGAPDREPHWVMAVLAEPGIRSGYLAFSNSLRAQPDLASRLVAFIAQQRGLPA